ncbi:hypothetical protein [Haloarchaeobius baliensis]|uniref:hypothetical protein n=1 Tax=Haloarchaeobius baliensis TaxID=1670458 RepID=UPI003F884807
MSFGSTWETLLENVEDLPDMATLSAPLTGALIEVRGSQDESISIQYRDRTETVALGRNRFETLCENVTEADDGFNLDRLPPNGEPYAVVLTLHPEFELDQDGWVLDRSAETSETALVENGPSSEPPERSEDDSELSIEQMMDNMGDPKERVTCPIDGCGYSHRSAASVARHVSGSSTDRHIWENTSYAGWRAFVRENGD